MRAGVDRRTVLKLVGAAGAWPAVAPRTVAAGAQAQAGPDIQPFTISVSDGELAGC